MKVYIRAEHVENLNNGCFAIVLSMRPLSPEDNVVLDRLFPHSGSDVDRLLSQEALLSALVSDAEALAPSNANPMPTSGQEVSVKRSKPLRPSSDYPTPRDIK